MHVLPNDKTMCLQHWAQECGIPLLGVSSPGPFVEAQRFRQWLDGGYNGTMTYLTHSYKTRMDPHRFFSNLASVIVVALPYHTPLPLSIECQSTENLWISRYAWGSDYHKVLFKKLKRLCTLIHAHLSPGGCLKPMVDTGPILERLYAARAGLGWIGKNNSLITRSHGSWVFLGVILSDIPFAPTSPTNLKQYCGKCTRCIDACPTKALIEPWLLDARLCLSYQTIENPAEIPSSLVPYMGNRLFGCDVCQDVCPWNRKAAFSTEQRFLPRPNLFNPSWSWVSTLTTDDFQDHFAGTPIKRRKFDGIQRTLKALASPSRNGRFNSKGVGKDKA